MSHAAVYARLSQQGEDEESIARQIKLCTARAEQEGWTPVLYVEPPGARSGFHESKRPAWLQLKKDIAAKSKDLVAVIVADLSRASRNLQHTLEFVALTQQHKIEFVSVREEINPNTASGRLYLAFAAALNQYERDNTSERKIIQYRARDKSIYSSNRHPFGINRVGHYPNIVWTPNEDFPTVQLIAELYVTGYGGPSIARELNKRGLTWKNVKGERVPVHIYTIDDVLAAFHRYAPFLDPALYAQFQLQRTRQHQHRTRVRQTVFPRMLLNGLLYCSECQQAYHAITQTKKRQYGTYVFRRYHHRNASCPNRRHVFIVPSIIETLVLERLIVLDQLSLADKSRIAHVLADPTPPPLDTKLQREKLLNRLRGFEIMRADGEISKERFSEVKSEITQALSELPEATPQTDPYTFEQALATVEHLHAQFQQLRDLDSAEANLLLRTHVIDKILFDGEQITAIQWLPPFSVLTVDSTRV